MRDMQMLNGNYWFLADASPVERYLGSFDDSGVPVRDVHHSSFPRTFQKGDQEGLTIAGFPVLDTTAVCWDPSGMVHMQEGLTMAGFPVSDTTAVCWEPCQKGPMMD